MVEIRPVIARVLAGLMAMGVTVLAGEGRLVHVVVVPVVVAMRVLVHHRPVTVTPPPAPARPPLPAPGSP